MGAGQLKTADFNGYFSNSASLISNNMLPPSGVFYGKSLIKADIYHTYLTIVKEGTFMESKGFGPLQLTPWVALNKKVAGQVSDNGYLVTKSNFKILTYNSDKANRVLLNMSLVNLDAYQLLNSNLNCYGWRNAVLENSGVDVPSDSPFNNE